MGVGSDNHWWMDVMENGEASLYADYFDINWHPVQPDLAGCLLLPVLGDHYGTVLESGQLSLFFDENTGNFSINYFEHCFPIDPKTYSVVLGYDLDRLEDRLGKQHTGFLELQTLGNAFDNLPGRQENGDDKRHMRHRNKEVNKRVLVRLCREHPAIRNFIEENVLLFNGESARPESYDLLHGLLEIQAYRLAFWRVATDEINYRRFFDINDLAGLRMQDNTVFHETHRLVFDLITTGKIDGLRIDHPDGLYDPYKYFCRIQASAAEASFDHLNFSQQEAAQPAEILLYVVVEKILAQFEHLPENWPINGTTGYDFSNLLNGLFIDAASEKIMTTTYHRFIGRKIDFDDLSYKCKKLIIHYSMAGELNVLASELYRLARADRHTRDFTLNRLMEALTEIVASFPVYRTYIARDRIQKSDIQFIEWAVAAAKNRGLADDVSVFDFIKDVLLLREREGEFPKMNYSDFVHKFQQYTGPVMAKGLEDTTFYIYNRLVSLNEVGGEPKRFGTSVTAFHRTNLDRMRYWPYAMLNTSTHDSKRSEDVRARINVLSEMPYEWRKRTSLWGKLNRPAKSQINGIAAPNKNDEYGFYQNLLGAWPIGAPEDEHTQQNFMQRMREYMVKASREAKVHTSWMTPNDAYEQALIRFVEKTLKDTNTPFLRDFLSLQGDISRFGMLNSLSQVLLKLTVPGVPDIYQGNELWQFCLVDPDNRRPVDFNKRQSLLQNLLDRCRETSGDRIPLLQEMLAQLPDGRAKIYVIAESLAFRRSNHDLFAKGAYLPLEAVGSKAAHICAFARKFADQLAIIVAPRCFFKLLQGKMELPPGKTVWGNTEIKLPAEIDGSQFENVFTQETIRTEQEKGTLQVSDILGSWPIALFGGNLINENEGAQNE
jgi:(1->4)-alpha-D-glucan 1-alpha-D-glucosylmutase